MITNCCASWSSFLRMVENDWDDREVAELLRENGYRIVDAVAYDADFPIMER